jgi:class 3 adenylate cyclase
MRVERHFAFVDLCEFTRYTDAHGDEQSVAVLTGFRAAARETCSDHGVRVAKWLGDGAMFVSTEASRLVSCILALKRRVEELEVALPLRAGLAGGAVILFEGDDYIGGPVNLAARLCDVAGPREILACAELAAFVPDDATARPMGSREIAGFAEPVEIVRIEASPVAASQ